MSDHGPFRAPEIKIYHSMQAEIDDLRGFIDSLVPNYAINELGHKVLYYGVKDNVQIPGP